MLCGIPNISVVEYGVSEVAEVEETSIPGGGWRATEAVEAVEVEETSIPGGRWRVIEAAEAAEVEETSIPDSTPFKNFQVPDLLVGGQQRRRRRQSNPSTACGSMKGVCQNDLGWRSPPPPPPPPPLSPSIYRLWSHETCTNYLVFSVERKRITWDGGLLYLHRLRRLRRPPSTTFGPMKRAPTICMLEGYRFMIGKHIQCVVEIQVAGFFEHALQTAGYTIKKPNRTQAAMRPPPPPPPPPPSQPLPNSAAEGHSGARGGGKLKGDAGNSRGRHTA
ncbi:hypothetical protein B0H17DRAFT_1132762 [Mycena rosella]|uniref:Uncharacterized protein n=1 Tax=Mycena rosella TaxID=1033263 RepID=A0AAD7GFY5_MYCRO|nr:hypothetical protein B0H17DRAFT_1132762 [Mycena rosella]